MQGHFSRDRSDCLEYIIQNSGIPTLVGGYVGYIRQLQYNYGKKHGEVSLASTISTHGRIFLKPAVQAGAIAACYFGSECLIHNYREKRNWKTPALAGAFTAFLVGGWKGWPQCAGYPLLGAFAGIMWYMIDEKIPEADPYFGPRHGVIPGLEFLGDPDTREMMRKPRQFTFFRNKWEDPLP